MKTLYLGPDELMVGIKVAVAATDSAGRWPRPSMRSSSASGRQSRSRACSMSNLTSTARVDAVTADPAPSRGVNAGTRLNRRADPGAGRVRRADPGAG